MVKVCTVNAAAPTAAVLIGIVTFETNPIFGVCFIRFVVDPQVARSELTALALGQGGNSDVLDKE